MGLVGDADGMGLARLAPLKSAALTPFEVPLPSDRRAPPPNLYTSTDFFTCRWSRILPTRSCYASGGSRSSSFMQRWGPTRLNCGFDGFVSSWTPPSRSWTRLCWRNLPRHDLACVASGLGPRPTWPNGYGLATAAATGSALYTSRSSQTDWLRLRSGARV